eukprot:jgi/Tetstr1/466181/TSEL_010741.t1
MAPQQRAVFSCAAIGSSTATDASGANPNSPLHVSKRRAETGTGIARRHNKLPGVIQAALQLPRQVSFLFEAKPGFLSSNRLLAVCLAP